MIHDQPDERELADRCSKGSTEARKELYCLYSEEIFALCLRYFPDAEDARELAHDSFVRIFDKIGRFSFQGEGSLRAWMLRVASNLSIDALRKRKRLKMSPLEEDFPDEEADTCPDVSEVPEEVLLQMIETLSDSKRVVFNMFCIDGYSHKEIAHICGITEKGSASILAKARKDLVSKLRKYLQDNE